MKDDNLSDAVNNVVKQLKNEVHKVIDEVAKESSAGKSITIEDFLMAWPNPRSLGVKPDDNSVGNSDPLLVKHQTSLEAYANAIWNKAIETAASAAQEYLSSMGYTGSYTFTHIMRLKK